MAAPGMTLIRRFNSRLAPIGGPPGNRELISGSHRESTGNQPGKELERGPAMVCSASPALLIPELALVGSTVGPILGQSASPLEGSAEKGSRRVLHVGADGGVHGAQLGHLRGNRDAHESFYAASMPRHAGLKVRCPIASFYELAFSAAATLHHAAGIARARATLSPARALVPAAPLASSGAAKGVSDAFSATAKGGAP